MSILSLIAWRTPATTCHAKRVSESSTIARLVGEDADVVVVDAGDADTAADEAADAVIVAEIEHAVDHEAERAGAPATGRADVRSDGDRQAAYRGPERRIACSMSSTFGALVGDFGLDAERAEIVADEERSVIAVIMVEHDLSVTRLVTVGVRPKSNSISSTIIPPKSPPTYQAPLRASAGVASTVDESATTMASFRIIFPFLLRPNRERP